MLVVVPACQNRGAGEHLSPGHRALIRAVGDTRPFEPRFTGLSAAGACDPASRPWCFEQPKPGTRFFLRLAAARREIATEPTAGPTARGLQARAVAGLLWGRSMAELDAAIMTLEQALTLEEGPELINDLAATHLMRARAGSPASLVQAYELSDLVLQAVPDSADALFNRALAVEMLGLGRPATDLWTDLAHRDGFEGWRPEIETHLRALAEPPFPRRWDQARERLLDHRTSQKELRTLVAAFRQPTRALVERELLPAWARQEHHPDMARRAPLARAAELSRLLAVVGGDQLLADYVAEIERAGEPGRQEIREQLRQGHLDFVAGLEALYERWNVEDAIQRFAAADSHFEDAAASYRDWVRFYRALGTYYQAEYRTAVRQLDTLSAGLRNCPCPNLRGRIHWVRGLAQMVLGETEAALQNHETARDLFTATGEMENLAAVHALIAESLEFLGRSDDAWGAAITSMRLLQHVLSPVRRHSILDSATRAAREQGRRRLALLLADSEVDSAQQADNDALLYNSLIRRAGARHEVGMLAPALADLADALEAAARLADDSMRSRAMADYRLVEGEMLLVEDSAAARISLDKAVEYYESTSLGLLLGRAYGARSRALQALGETDLAVRDLERFLEAHERAEQSAPSGRSKATLRLEARPTVRRLMELSLDNPLLAFTFFERAQATAEEKHIDLAALRERLPDDAAVLIYQDLSDSAWAWVVSSKGLAQVGLRVPSSEIRSAAQVLLHGVRSRQTAAYQRAARRLHQALIAPLEPHLEQIGRLGLALDPSFGILPMELLIDPASERSLIDSYTVSYVGSASEFVRLSTRLARPAPASPITLIANPGTSSTADRLLHTGRETDAVASLYPGATVLSGADATARGFLRAAAQAEVVHFAGHAVADLRIPHLSRLAMAPDARTPGALYVGDIERGALPAARVVVLAGCATSGFDPAYPESHLMTLARPFLTAGAATVVATLWDVEDEVAADLMIRLHRALRDGLDPAGALRLAKLEYRTSNSASGATLAHWSPFIVLGGQASGRR